MAYGKYFILLAAVVLALVAISEAGGKKKMEFKCLGEVVKPASDEEEVNKQCETEIKKLLEANKKAGNNESDEKTVKMGITRCFGACKNRKQGVLTSEGKLDTSALNARIDKMAPEAAREGIKNDSKNCGDSITEKLSDDNMCKSHEAYQKCLMTAWMNNCKQQE